MNSVPHAEARHSVAHGDHDQDNSRTARRLTPVGRMELLAEASRDRRLTDFQVRVLVALNGYYNHERGRAWPGESLLAWEVGGRRESVARAIVRLEQLRYIRVWRRPRGGNPKGGGNVYFLLGPDARAGEAALGDGIDEAGDAVQSAATPASVRALRPRPGVTSSDPPITTRVIPGSSASDRGVTRSGDSRITQNTRSKNKGIKNPVNEHGEPQQPSVAGGAPARKPGRRTRLREDFEVTHEMRQWAVQRGVPADLVDDVTLAFEDSNLAYDIKRHDWEGAWMTYVRTDGLEFARRLAGIRAGMRGSAPHRDRPEERRRRPEDQDWTFD